VFRKRRQNTLKQAILKARDPALRELHAELRKRQQKVAQLELELSDTRANLARFEHELETSLGPLYRRLEELENRLREARRKAAHRLQWGDRADSPDVPKDVFEQFYKTWTSHKTKTKPPPPQQISENEKVELKNLFRSLAKMYHPDLVTDPEQKSWRAQRMAQINQAYISDDLNALKDIADKPAEPEPGLIKTPIDATASLKAEIQRLGGVIVDLERTLTQLINSHTVQLMLDVSMARRVGQNLLAQMANDLQAKVLNMEAELESLSNI
jgi:hypothetical protein